MNRLKVVLLALIISAHCMYAGEALEQLRSELAKTQAETAPQQTISELQKEEREELAREKRRLEPEYEWLVTGKEEKPAKTESFTEEDAARHEAAKQAAQKLYLTITEQLKDINKTIYEDLSTQIRPFLKDSKISEIKSFQFNLAEWNWHEAGALTLGLYKDILNQLNSKDSEIAQLTAKQLETRIKELQKNLIAGGEQGDVFFKRQTRLWWNDLMKKPWINSYLITETNNHKLYHILNGTRYTFYPGTSIAVPIDALSKFLRLKKTIDTWRIQ